MLPVQQILEELQVYGLDSIEATRVALSNLTTSFGMSLQHEVQAAAHGVSISSMEAAGEEYQRIVLYVSANSCTLASSFLASPSFCHMLLFL
jgi:hypothetical protein